jgi:hypothetical protein
VTTHDDIDSYSQPELHIKPKVDNWMRAPPDYRCPCTSATQSICSRSSARDYCCCHRCYSTTQCQPGDVQKSLLMLHGRLTRRISHDSMDGANWQIQSQDVSTCDPPKCASCLLGKMTKRPTKTSNSPLPKKDREMAL